MLPVVQSCQRFLGRKQRLSDAVNELALGFHKRSWELGRHALVSHLSRESEEWNQPISSRT